MKQIRHADQEVVCLAPKPKSRDKLENFGLEWQLYERTRYDEETGRRYTAGSFQHRTGFDPSKLQGQTILDAGCGSGRFIRFLDASVVGVDASRSVFFARAGIPRNVDLVQADIFSLPFRDGTFDKIFSLGVLHHTSDARRAFYAVSSVVKPGGECSVSLYSNEGLARRYANALGGIARALLSSVGLTALYRICRRLCSLPIPQVLLAEPYLRPTDLKLSPALALNFFLPFLSNAVDQDNRTLDTFDYLSPKHQSKHTYAEVEGWFRNAGFKEIERLEIPVTVKGRKSTLDEARKQGTGGG